MRGKGTGRARKGHILERNTETMDHLDGGSSCGERGAGLGPRKVLRGCTHPAALNSCRRRGLVVPKVQPSALTVHAAPTETRVHARPAWRAVRPRTADHTPSECSWGAHRDRKHPGRRLGRCGVEPEATPWDQLSPCRRNWGHTAE